MKTDHRPRVWPFFLFTLAIFASALSPAHAERTDPLALNKPEKLIGSWKAIGGSMGEAMTLTFSGDGDFKMLITSKGGRKALGEGTYTVKDGQWPMRVSAVAGGKQVSFGIAILPNDLIVVWITDSDDDPLGPTHATLMLRQDAAPASGISSSEESTPSGLQKRENLIGTWKHTDLKVSMSFSDKGEYELRNKKNGKLSLLKGSYTVTSRGDSLVVHVAFDGGEDYYSIKLLSKDRIAWQQLKSPQPNPIPTKKSSGFDNSSEFA